MRFILDNNIPPRLLGHDAIHVQDTDKGSDTEDPDIALIADLQHRIVLTKDKDFFKLHMISGSPQKVLMVRLGNCSMNELWDVLSARLPQIEGFFEDVTIVEVYPNLTAYSTPRRGLK